MPTSKNEANDDFRMWTSPRENYPRHISSHKIASLHEKLMSTVKHQDEEVNLVQVESVPYMNN